MATPESPPPSRRLRVSIGEVMGLVALAALACAWPGLIPTQVVIVATWVAARRGSERARGRLVSLGLVLAAVYLPPLANYVLPPLVDPGRFGDGLDWRRAWWSMIPIAPAAPASALGVIAAHRLFGIFRFFRWGQIDVALYVLASLATAAEVCALTLLAGQTPARRAIAVTLGSLTSALSSYEAWTLVLTTLR